MSKKNKKIEEAGKRAGQDLLYWVLVIICSVAVLNLSFLTLNYNVKQVTQAPTNDFELFKQHLGEVAQKAGDIFKGAPKLDDSKAGQSLRDAALGYLVNKPASAPAQAAAADPAGESAQWKNFNSGLGLSLQYPSDWTAHETKIGAVYELVLTNDKDAVVYFKISQPLIDGLKKVSLEKVLLAGARAVKYTYSDKNQNQWVVIRFTGGKLAGYGVTYGLSNQEYAQVYQSILETIKFTD